MMSEKIDEFMEEAKATINRYLSLLEVIKGLECTKLGKAVKCEAEVVYEGAEYREMYGTRPDGYKTKAIITPVSNDKARITFYFWKEEDE